MDSGQLSLLVMKMLLMMTMVVMITIEVTTAVHAKESKDGYTRKGERGRR